MPISNGNGPGRFDAGESRRRWERLLDQAERDRTGPPADPLGAIAGVLDQAHRALGAQELAEVLLATERAIVPLHAGRLPARPRPRLPNGQGRLSPAARVYVRPVRVALYLGARQLDSQSDSRVETLAHLGASIQAYLEEVAVRPRGAAMPLS